MTYAVVVTRRFAIKENGRAFNRELRRRVELPIPPVDGLWLDFGDGCTVQVQHVTARVLPPAPWGILPDTLEVRIRTEPAERLEAALAAGWLPVDDPAVAPAPAAEG